MTELERAFVLAGGLSVERDVSLRSGRRVADALRAVGVEAVLLDADAQLLPRLPPSRPDAVFIALHGGPGEDGALRGVLDLMGVAYAGTSAHACRLAFDKPTAKSLIAGAGMKTPPWLALPHATFRELGASTVIAQIVERLGLPLMVKPAAGGSALGATIVTRAGRSARRAGGELRLRRHGAHRALRRGRRTHGGGHRHRRRARRRCRPWRSRR